MNMQPRSQGFSLEGGKGAPPIFKGKALGMRLIGGCSVHVERNSVYYLYSFQRHLNYQVSFSFVEFYVMHLKIQGEVLHRG